MKAIEFYSVIDADHTLLVPQAVADSVPTGRAVRFLVLIEDQDADDDWRAAAGREFGLGYADSDAIYDQLAGR